MAVPESAKFGRLAISAAVLGGIGLLPISEIAQILRLSTI
jgi:hypothetical protein